MTLFWNSVVPAGDYQLSLLNVELFSGFLLTFRLLQSGYHVETPQAERDDSCAVRNAGVVGDYSSQYLGVVNSHNVGGVERALEVTQSGRSGTKEIGTPDTGYELLAAPFERSRQIAVNWVCEMDVHGVEVRRKTGQPSLQQCDPCGVAQLRHPESNLGRESHWPTIVDVEHFHMLPALFKFL